MKSSINKATGFTLIEILIALAILSIALTAIVRSTMQNIKDTAYLQNKAIAEWVGIQVVNEARVGVVELSEEKMEGKTTMLRREWPWAANMQPTKNPHISKIDVTVYQPSNHSALNQLVSYVYAP